MILNGVPDLYKKKSRQACAKSAFCNAAHFLPIKPKTT